MTVCENIVYTKRKYSNTWRILFFCQSVNKGSWVGIESIIELALNFIIALLIVYALHASNPLSDGLPFPIRREKPKIIEILWMILYHLWLRGLCATEEALSASCPSPSVTLLPLCPRWNNPVCHLSLEGLALWILIHQGVLYS